MEKIHQTGYGLSGSIFGKDKHRMNRIIRKVKTGNMSINDVFSHYGIASLPFGGEGISGLGRLHGKEGLRSFSHQKGYMSNRIQLKSEFWWYKRSEKFGKFLKKWIKWQYS